MLSHPLNVLLYCRDALDVKRYTSLSNWADSLATMQNVLVEKAAQSGPGGGFSSATMFGFPDAGRSSFEPGW